VIGLATWVGAELVLYGVSLMRASAFKRMNSECLDENLKASLIKLSRGAVITNLRKHTL
jgi:hypothetical protein